MQRYCDMYMFLCSNSHPVFLFVILCSTCHPMRHDIYSTLAEDLAFGVCQSNSAFIVRTYSRGVSCLAATSWGRDLKHVGEDLLTHNKPMCLLERFPFGNSDSIMRIGCYEMSNRGTTTYTNIWTCYLHHPLENIGLVYQKDKKKPNVWFCMCWAEFRFWSPLSPVPYFGTRTLQIETLDWKKIWPVRMEPGVALTRLMNFWLKPRMVPLTKKNWCWNSLEEVPCLDVIQQKCRAYSLYTNIAWHVKKCFDWDRSLYILQRYKDVSVLQSPLYSHCFPRNESTCASKEVVGTMPPAMQLLRVGKVVEFCIALSNSRSVRFVFVLTLGKHRSIASEDAMPGGETTKYWLSQTGLEFLATQWRVLAFQIRKHFG